MADGASEEIVPSFGRRESHVIDEPHGIEMTFDYLDMIEHLQNSLDTPTINKLCEYFNMTSSLDKIRASSNPQHYFLIECRRMCIITGKDTTKLLEAFREIGLSNPQSIIEDYNHFSKCPDVHVMVNNDNPTSVFSNFKTFMLSKKRAIKTVLTRDQGIHFVDCQEGSLVICLKVSSVETLDKLKENIESGKLLRRLMAMYENEISDTRKKDFQAERSSIKVSYHTEEFENAKQQLTTNNASFRRSIAITKSVTQTRTETTILQEEMKEVFHPPSVVQSLSDGGCSVTSEETQTKIGTTTSQQEMEEYVDAIPDIPSLSEKDDRDSEEDFLEYLDEVGLKEYFPRKLTMQKAREVRLFPSDDSQIKTKDLPFLFISKLTSLDSRITWKENLHVEGSVRDFIYAILRCSDNHLRQHLLEKLACCQLALPILLPGRNHAKPELLTWGLSRVVKKWKENEASLAQEKLMLSERVFTTAFIRFGDIPISKSYALNNVIGRAQGNETFRYFLSYEYEKENVYYCCGTVEGQWYLPMYGRKEDLLKEVTLLLNLRGDSKEFTTESEFMCRIANAIFIFVDKHNLQCYKTAIDGIKKRLTNVFVIHLIPQKGSKGRQTRREQLNSWGKTLEIDENDNSVDFEVERNVAELAKIICEKILQYCKNTSRNDYRSIEDWITSCFNDISVDQDNDSYNKAKQLLQSSFPNHESIENMKKSYLQLQVEWGKWVEADKEPMCVEAQSVAYQSEKKEKTKHDMRRKQRQKGLSAKMKVFFETLQTVMFDENDLLYYFMSLFQTYIEMMTAREIPTLITRINVSNTSLQKLKSEMKQASPSKRSKQQNKIKDLQKQLLTESEQVSAKNISCEHFIRELGQWYEANLEDENCREQNELLVNMASKLLLAGYPLELLDGENAYIPIKWISGVLKNLANKLHNPRIFALSIIGIQSSGKSTLLNSMFGVKLPVRAGRCTRGLYLQLLEVNVSFHKQLGFEYLLIIDTEGLQSPDRTVFNDHIFDNSIATLTMCIVDLTLLTIGQETIGPDMIGVLQIVVHALIRMKEVNLVSNFRIIQQRVSDIAAAANNKTNMTKIKDVLNRVTSIAAAQEKVDHIHDFSDIFTLAEEDDLQFFPCLWTGLMSPPNSGYSDKIHALKDAIFKPNVNHPQFTMTKFVGRLEDVWQAIKTEDFIFHFQNSFDVFSNQRFRLEHSKLIGKMRTELFRWELTNGRTITNATKGDFYRRLQTEIGTKCEDINKKIDEYVKEHSDEEEVRRRQESIKNETIEIGKDILRGIKENTEKQLQNKADNQGLQNFIEKARLELKFAAREAANILKHVKSISYWKVNHDELDRKFEVLWDEKVKQLEKQFQKYKIAEEFIETACDNSFRKLLFFTQYSKECTDELQGKPHKQWTIWERGKDLSHQFARRILGSKDGLEKVQTEVCGIVNGFKTDLINHAEVKPFHESLVDTVLQEVYNALTQSNVNSEFVVRTLRTYKNEVCTVCKDCQLKYESHNSLQTLFENEKKLLKEDFKGYVDENLKSLAAVKRSYSECVIVSRNVILNAFNAELLEQMRKKDSYDNKQRMIGRILEELCREKDPKMYLNFIQDNEKFVSNWLRKNVLKEIETRSQHWVTDVIDPKINEILGYVQSALRKTEHELKASRGKKTTTFEEWGNMFLKNDYISDYGMNMQFSVDDFNLTDIEEFTNMLHTMFSSHFKTDITKGWDLDKLSDPSVASQLYSKMRDVARDILDHLGTCKEVCPFCKVPCHLQNRGKHDHTAISHYPLGLAGIPYNKSETLASETCTMLVASEIKYLSQIGTPNKYKPFKEFAKDYPFWKISPRKGADPILYWKWVLQNFNDDFAEFYKAKAAKIPQIWGTVSEEDALKSLRENYHLTKQKLF